MEATVMVNFRVKPEERTQLRVVLLQRGQTIQEYFTAIVARILENAGKTSESSAPANDDQCFQRQRQAEASAQAPTEGVHA